jgi:hypothetical protein
VVLILRARRVGGPNGGESRKASRRSLSPPPPPPNQHQQTHHQHTHQQTHTLAHPHPHAEGKRCIVYDVVFHPDALRMAATNAAFKQMLAKTAVDAIGQRFPEQMLSPDVKYPKMTFKA